MPTSCSSYADPAENTQADSTSSPQTLRIASGGALVGLWTSATGADAATLIARGPSDPPVPDLCCSVCKGEDHDGTAYALYTDQTLSTPAACVGFELQFNPAMGWICLFRPSGATEPTPPGADPVFFYTL